MSKSKHSAEWRTDIVKKYLLGEGSFAVLAKEYGIGETTLRDWVHRYRKHGIVGFGNNRGSHKRNLLSLPRLERSFILF